MYQTLNCIALRTVKHSDRSTVLSAFSREAGRVSFVLPAGGGRGAARLKAITSPGARFTCVVRSSSGESLLRPIDPMPVGSPVMPDHPAKPAITLFLVDVLGSALRETPAEPLLYDFVSGMLEQLAHSECRVADFHIVFLVRLTHFLGIEPDVASWQQGYVFDMQGGVFQPVPPGHNRYIEAREAGFLPRLMRITLRNSICFRFSATTRNLILDNLIRYYTYHGILPGEPRSLPILRALF